MLNVSCVPPTWPTMVSKEVLAPICKTAKSVQPESSDTFKVDGGKPSPLNWNRGNLSMPGVLELPNVTPLPGASTVLTGRNCASSAGVRPTVRHGLQFVIPAVTVWMDCAAPVTGRPGMLVPSWALKAG